MVVARVLARPRLSAAANDVEPAICHDQLLVSTLRHFARYGLGAAQEARRLAQEAQGQQDGDRYRHWLAVSRHLDHGMAGRMDTESRRGRR